MNLKRQKPDNKTLSRQCISCRRQLPRNSLIRLTRIKDPNIPSVKVVLNPNRFQLGRSVYLCKLSNCINLAMKDKKITKMLRVKNAEEKVVMV